MDDRIVLAVIVVVGVPAILVGYITLVEGAVGALESGPRERLRPWLWVLPALACLAIFWLYPVANTLYLSVRSSNSEEFVGLSNFAYVFTNDTMLLALRNNIVWLVLFTLLTVGGGLLAAVLTDRVPYESAAKSIIFLPMAISAVGTGVIWRFMYDYRPPGTPQRGTLNALITLIPGVQPQAWLINEPINTIALVVAYAWIWTGFCMVILSAGLKGIPGEVLEAARTDGATEWRVFWGIIFPMLGSTIAVVATVMLVNVIKTFDIVYVMTNGNFNTEVIANRWYKEMFNFKEFGRASAIAVVLMLAIIPIMIYNLREFRAQEARR
ncbi:MAG: sugar ABC transporter permease [Chloroflexi bacterium]|nr:sugar ABC transporter permease [Chloroflexota bacterium]